MSKPLFFVSVENPQVMHRVKTFSAADICQKKKQGFLATVKTFFDGPIKNKGLRRVKKQCFLHEKTIVFFHATCGHQNLDFICSHEIRLDFYSSYFHLKALMSIQLLFDRNWNDLDLWKRTFAYFTRKNRNISV